DLITVVSPGFSYANGGRGWKLDFDYAFEAAFFTQNSNFDKSIDSQSGQASLSWQPASGTELSLVNIFRQSRDPTDQLIPGAVIGLTRAFTNYLTLGLTHRFRPKLGAGLSYVNTIQSIDDPSLPDIRTDELAASLSWGLSQRNELEIVQRVRRFDFSGPAAGSGAAGPRRNFGSPFPGSPDDDDDDEADEFQPAPRDQTAIAGSIGLRRNFSERVSARAQIGGEHTGADSGRTFLIGGVGLEAAAKYAALLVEYERGLITGTALNVLLFEDAVNASVLVRILRGLQGSFEFSASRVFTVDQVEFGIDELSARAALSYALTDSCWLRARVSWNREMPENLKPIEANSLTLSVVMNY
ncbi:MAG: hypothetical protein HKO62_06775, partial [Gammaproteobacteria bacterium]|nr:hypothetical protein [Gammaproteobacteria bacterium]